MRELPEVIAEAGVNHNGSVDTALAMVDAACSAGADAVKFQTYSVECLLRPGDPNWNWLESMQLSRSGFVRIAERCRVTGIEFMSTPGDADSLRFLVEECGVRRIKIGSDDLTNIPLLAAAFGTGLPLVISTGMASIEEVEGALRISAAVDTVKQLTGEWRDIALLQCTSLYPCPPVHVNLTAMVALKQKFSNCRIGYSDHTGGTHMCVAAAALGAEVIEKHFCLRAGTGCADESVSVSPRELALMVSQVREVREARGVGLKFCTQPELEVVGELRKDPRDWLRGVKP